MALLEEPAEARFLDIEELRGLAAEGRERGYLTFEEIAACLEEVEVTKEQVVEFRAHLLELGVEIVAESDAGLPRGVAVPSHGDGANRRRRRRSPRSTSRWSPAWTRCGSTCARSGEWICSRPARRWRSRVASSAAT